MIKSAYEGLNARPKVYLSKEYFCEMYPTWVSSKLCEFIIIVDFIFSLSCYSGGVTLAPPQKIQLQKAQHSFPKIGWGRGGQRPFGSFPKIHQIWQRKQFLVSVFTPVQSSLRTIKLVNFYCHNIYCWEVLQLCALSTGFYSEEKSHKEN